MTLRKRIGALERVQAREPGGAALDLSHLGPAALEAMAEAYGESLDCPGNFQAALLARIVVAKEAGTFPQSLSDTDLRALLYAYDAMEGKT